MRYRLIAVRSVDRDRANEDARTFDILGGLRTFEQPYSNNGGATLTHYVCSVLMDDDFVNDAVADQLQAEYPNALTAIWDIQDDPNGAQNALARLGLVRYTI